MKHLQNPKILTNHKINTQSIAIDLKGEAGKRVILNAVKRVMKTHTKEITALADK